jgi:hypothetical protein
MWSDPTYIIDKARLVDWVERALERPMKGLGEDEFEDYCRLCDVAAYLIANKLTIQYLESQPDLPTEELSPFVILNEGSEELKTICQKMGISEQTYWFLDQGWTKRNILKHTLSFHAKRQSDREIEIDEPWLNAFTQRLCGQFIQQPEGEEQTNG